MLQLTDTNFAERIRTAPVAFVDFGAAWCPPCKVLLPIMEELEREHAGALAVFKVDVEEATETAALFGIMSMPTVILFRDGQPVDKLVGLRTKATYNALLEKTSAAL